MHYVRPGAVRIGARALPDRLRALAFEQKSGIVVVLINKTVFPPPGSKRNRKAPPAEVPEACRVLLTGIPAGRRRTIGNSGNSAWSRPPRTACTCSFPETAS